MNFMFDLEDASNDGTIDAQEFALVCSSYGLDAKECEQAFAKMSKVSVFLWSHVQECVLLTWLWTFINANVLTY